MSKSRFLLAALLMALVAGAPRSVSHARLREGPDLKPRPDALEYGLTAARLADGGSYSLEIGGVRYPPRYPPGFPLLAAPIVRAAGGAPWDAWKASFLYALLTIVLTALAAQLVAGRVAALVAGLVVAASPAHVVSSGLAMSETASTFLGAAVLLLVAVAVRGRPAAPRILPLALAGAALAAALAVRYTGLAPLLPALLLVATRHRLAPARPLVPAIALLTPVLVGGALLLEHHRATFGRALSDGYHFWVPVLYGTPLCFNAAYALQPGPAAPWPHGNLSTYGKVLAGLDGDLLTPFVAVLAVAGFVWVVGRARSCPIARWTALACGVALPATLGFHLVYYWQDPRFLIPLLPFLAVLAGAGARWLGDGAARLVGPARGARIGPAIAATIAIVAAVHLAWPRLATTPPAVPSLTSALPRLDATLERDAIVVVNFPLTLAARALGRDREVLVASREDDPHLNAIAAYALRGEGGHEPATPYLAADGAPFPPRLLQVEERVRAGRPVYVVVAVSEAGEGPGIAALRQRFTLDEEIATVADPRGEVRKPVTVYRVRPR